MSHWWSPKTFVRMKELELLQKQCALLEARGLPIPPALTMKIQELTVKVSS